MNMSRLVQEVSKTTLDGDDKYLILEAVMNDLEEGEDVDVPYIRFKFR